MLSNFDKELLQRCLNRSQNGWEEFVDRFIGLILHVVQHTARSRSLVLYKDSIDDLVSEVFLQILQDDMAVLRRFRMQSSLATYLTIIARRVVLRNLSRRRRGGKPATSAEANLASPGRVASQPTSNQSADHVASNGGVWQPSDSRLAAREVALAPATESELEIKEEIEAAISSLSEQEAIAVRMFYLEGKTYHEISSRLELSENSVGPYLSRAREKMRASRDSNANV